MPELFRKVLCTTGTKHTPQGLLTLTPSRAERYARKFKQLRQKFRFPQPWGHKLSAMPEVGATDEEKQEANERRQFELARWNSGYIQDVEATKDGNLVIVGQVPPGYRVDMPSGDLINDRDGTRIGEVSGAFGNWKDGSGNYHKDILVHAALVTHPVDAGTGGFEKFEKADKVEPGMNMLSGAGEIEYTFFLSSRSPDMAKDKDDDKDDLDKLSGIDKSLEKGDKSPIEETVTEEDEYTPEPEPIIEPPAPIAPLPVTPLPPSGDLMPKIKQLEGMFGEMQISLPPSEDVATFVNNMLVAITVARSLGVKFNKPDDESANTQQTTMQSGQDKPPSPEAPPIMMSTLSGPALALAEREQNRQEAVTRPEADPTRQKCGKRTKSWACLFRFATANRPNPRRSCFPLHRQGSRRPTRGSRKLDWFAKSFRAFAGRSTIRTNCFSSNFRRLRIRPKPPTRFR